MKPKILLVENDVESFSVTGHLLRLHGYEVQTASHYQEVITIAAAARCGFDLLICDIGLPDGNGCALLRELRQRFGLDGIAITAFGRPWDVREIKRAGFLHHLVEPVDFEDLQAAIEDAAGMRRCLEQPAERSQPDGRFLETAGGESQTDASQSDRAVA